VSEPGRVGRRAPALRYRNFRLFLAGQVVSQIGTQVQALGQAWLVLVLTSDPFILGLATAIQGVPIAAFALLGGAIADRVSKRRLIVVTQSAQLILALVLGLLCLTESVEVWHVLGLAFVLGCVNAIDMPARQSFVVEMVGPDGVASAVGLGSSSYNTARLVGPAIAGLVIGVATTGMGDAVRGTGVAFVINAVSFGAVVLGLLLMRDVELFAIARPAASRGLAAVAREIGVGLAHVRDSRLVLVSLLAGGLISTVATNFTVLVPVLAREELGLDAGGLGLLMSAVGLGALVAALRVGMGGRAGPDAIVGGTLVLALALVFAGVLGPPLVVAALFAAGFGSTSMRTAVNTSVQLATPAALRGRVMSVFAIVFEGSSPIGGVLSGALAATLGGAVSFVVTGVAALGLAAAAAPLLGRARATPSGAGPVRAGSAGPPP
jgi:MFS family permease